MNKLNTGLLILIIVILIGGGWWYFSKDEEREKCSAKINYVPSQTSDGDVKGGYYWVGYGMFEPLCLLGKQCRYGSYEEAMASCVR